MHLLLLRGHQRITGSNREYFTQFVNGQLIQHWDDLFALLKLECIRRQSSEEAKLNVAIRTNLLVVSPAIYDTSKSVLLETA